MAGEMKSFVPHSDGGCVQTIGCLILVAMAMVAALIGISYL